MDARELDAVRLLALAFMEAGKFGPARDLLAGLAEADPSDAFARRNLALAHLRLGEYAAAEPLTRRMAAEAAGADRAPALFFHAYALWGNGKEDDCRRTVELYAECLAQLREAEK